MRLLTFSVIALLASYASAANVTPEEALRLRDEVREMFYHAFQGYMQHAFPLDELRPMSCTGEDSLGGYALTLVDSLDMLALLGDHQNFSTAVEWLGKHLRFDKNKTVSVFETNIRVLGGLLAAHLIAKDASTGMQVDSYDDELLHLAEDLGRRLLPAFETPTGIPYGSVNLLHGVNDNESKVTSTAGGGTLTLEFGVLSRLSKDPVFEIVARNAVRGLWAQRSPLGLVGAHINVFSGEWTHKDAGIGTSIDSFYEYLLKVNMNSAMVVWPLFNSLQAFWPGLQVLAGDLEPARHTHKAFFSVWKRYGFTPEGFNLATSSVQPGQRSYPLRPELIESTYWLYKATRDPMYLDVGRDMVASLQYGARCPCGYCHIADVESHIQDDHMESFFLAETIKYLWLLFDLAVGGNNLVEKGPYPYIFTTEGHILPMTSEISLVDEHCTYRGSFCDEVSQERDTSLPIDPSILNSTIFHERSHNESWHSCPESEELDEDSNLSGELHAPLKGLCPGFTFHQRLGISPQKVSAEKKKQDVKQERALREKIVELLQKSSGLQTILLEDKRVEFKARDHVQLDTEDLLHVSNSSVT
ncbi:hypothetical protein KP509_20G042800 [Ceratopteris richardii]|uniref:alpha-1,2-Mannosidase n=1 Tax=Ceratopteris richardii TaxID=49495 RepID=A0A8T2SGX3_CERRI|nr:hypothetical protein KP509_20G042800 [Ceratopteris richardii]